VTGSDPQTQVSARPITWTIWALAAVLPLLFGILIWQLIGLNPERYCQIVKTTGEPTGADCFNLLMEGLKIKGYTIWGIIAMMALFVLIVLVAAVKAVVSVAGPGGLQLNINSKDDTNDPA
jgi:small-conductance mechanosensitive channel